MTEVPYMNLYVGDYLGDTQHLTTEQHGAYLLLLMAMWRAGGSLPNDPAKLARIARVNPRRWRLISPEVVAFMTVDGDQITQSRLKREHQKVASIRELRSASGKAGVLAKALKTKEPAQANGSRLLKQNGSIPKPYPEPDKKKEIDISPPDSIFEPARTQLALVPAATKMPAKEENQDFEQWWKQYPRRVDKGSARKAYERVVKAGKATAEQLIAGAMRYAAERQHEDPKYTKHASTWLNAEAWGNETAPSLAAGGNQNRAPQSRADSAIEGMMSYFNERERQ